MRCGIIGIYSRGDGVAAELYEGLLMLQHRGQDSAGMVTTDWAKFVEHKANGLVRDVFGDARVMAQMQGARSPLRRRAGLVLCGTARDLCAASASAGRIQSLVYTKVQSLVVRPDQAASAVLRRAAHARRAWRQVPQPAEPEYAPVEREQPESEPPEPPVHFKLNLPRLRRGNGGGRECGVDLWYAQSADTLKDASGQWQAEAPSHWRGGDHL